jgi:hypothetical protein
MKVYLNRRDSKTDRILVEVELMNYTSTKTHFWCKLQDGNVIKRSVKRDLPKE